MPASTDEGLIQKPVTIPYTPWNPSAAHLMTPQEKEAKRAEKKPAPVAASVVLSEPLRELLRKNPGIHTPHIVPRLNEYGVKVNTESVFRLLYKMRGRGEVRSEADTTIRPITHRWWLAQG